MGSFSQTAGAHNVSKKSGYSASFAPQKNLKRLVGKGGDNATPSKKKSDNVDMLASMMEQGARIEKDDGDPDQANFAGMMGAFM
jgi:hypothetical protein